MGSYKVKCADSVSDCNKNISKCYSVAIHFYSLKWNVFLIKKEWEFLSLLCCMWNFVLFYF